MVSTNRSLFKGEAPRFPANFVRPLLSEGPFKFRRHLVWALVINWIFAMSDKISVNTYMLTETDTEMDTEMDTDMDKDTGMELEYFC